MGLSTNNKAVNNSILVSYIHARMKDTLKDHIALSVGCNHKEITPAVKLMHDCNIQALVTRLSEYGSDRFGVQQLVKINFDVKNLSTL